MSNLFQAPIQDFTNKNSVQSTYSGKFNLQGLSEADLLALRQQIDEKLPYKALQDMNLEQAYVLQYRRVCTLQEDLLRGGTEIDPSKLASFLKVVQDSIVKLAGLQESVYSSERHKWMESIMVDSINLMPREAQEHFLNEYEKMLTKFT